MASIVRRAGGREGPLVALHGAGVDHREIEAAVEAIVPGTGYRRIYPDLPGMGGSTTDGLTCNDDVVKLFGDLIDHLVGGSAAARAFLRRLPGVGSQTFTSPTLIAAGRRDSVVGYTDATDLLERYPHATLAVVEDAGYALMHERPELLAAFFGGWRARARPHDK